MLPHNTLAVPCVTDTLHINRPQLICKIPGLIGGV